MKIKHKLFTTLLLTSSVIASLNAQTFDIESISTEGMLPHYMVAQEGPVFPCDLYGNIPEVIIIGTGHLSKAAQSLKDLFLVKASQGSYYLAQEGTAFEEDYSDYEQSEKINNEGIKKYVFGIEDKPFYSMIILGRHLTDMVHMKGDHIKAAHISVLLDIVLNSFINKVFLSIDQNLLVDNYSEDMAAGLMLFSTCKNQDDFLDLYTELMKTTFSKISNEEYIEFTQHLGRLMIKEFKKMHPEYKTSIATNLFNEPENEKYLLQFTLQDAVLVRDQFFIKNFGKAYCKHYKEGKQFIINVGALHVADLEKLIKEHSAGKIKVIPSDLRSL